MAAKVNTRLLLIVVLAFGAALALLGGVYVLKMRGDATRNFRKGEDAFAKADFITAYDQFGRALGKDPGNAQYLQRAQDSLTQLVPQTAGEAQEKYGRYLALLGHAAVHNPQDPNAHLMLLRELHGAARRTNAQQSWESLVAAADSMNLRVPDGDPLKPLALVYKALGVGRLAPSKSDEEIQLAVTDLDIAAAALKNNDLAWSAEIYLRLAAIEKMTVSGRSETSIQTQREALNAAAQRAIESAPDGPETALAYLTVLMVRKAERADSVSEEDIRSAAEHAVTCLDPGASAITASETAAMLQYVPKVGRVLAARVLDASLASHPQAFDQKMQRARLAFQDGELDPAEALITEVLHAPIQPVGLMSRLQFVLRPQAASLQGDIEFNRFDRLPVAERAAQLQKMKQARELLASLSIDPENDPMLVRADGKIAFAEAKYVDAAAKFEQLVRLNERDPEILAFSAVSLQQIGQIGLAHERISAASATNPGHVPWLLAKAELELRMGRAREAAQTIEPIPDTALTQPRVQQVVSMVRRAASLPTTMPTTGDAVQVAILAANDALTKNEPENARAVLLAALANSADSLALLRALAQVELRAGNREAASDYVQRGLVIQPNDQLLNQLSVGLRFDDPIQATMEYLKATVPDEKERLTNVLVSMVSMSLQRQQLAAQFTAAGDAERAKNAKDVADRAMAQAKSTADQLAKVAPENPQLIEFRFSQAVQEKDWAKAAEQVSIARRANADAVDGLLFQGRMELARGNARDAIIALESVTDRLSFSAYAWRVLASAYQAAGNFAQAERAYEQAYRCNPNDINGARTYIALLVRRGDKTRALQILRSVQAISPDDSALRESWLDLEADVGEAAIALKQRGARYASNPEDRINAADFARLLATLTPSREIILDEAGEPIYSQQRWMAMSAVEQENVRAETRTSWNSIADSIVENLSKDHGDDLRVVVLRATILRERGDVFGGETVLREFIAKRDRAQQTEDMYMELARYQAAASRNSDAVQSLRDAIALGGPNVRAAEINLGVLLMQMRQHDEALTILESARARQDDPTLRLQIVECLIQVGRLDDAEKALSEAVSGSGGSVATLLHAQIAKARGDQLLAKGDLVGAEKPLAQQRELLAQAEQQDPTNPLPRILLAQSLIDEYNRTQNRTLLDDAMVALDRAERIRTGMPEVSALRVAIQKELGDRASAIAELQRSLETAPGNITARRDLVQLMLEGGDSRGALAVIDAAIRQNPTVAVWHEMRGDLTRQLGAAPADVATSYAAAYERAPNLAMLLKLADALLAKSPPDCGGVVDRLAAREADLSAEPAVREMYARALMCSGKKDQAVEQLRLAYARRMELAKEGAMPPADIARWFQALSSVFPREQAAEAERLFTELSSPSPTEYELAAMAGVWMRSGEGGMSHALELQRQAVTLCPIENSDLRADLNSDLADMLILSGDFKGAAEAYDVVLRLRPTDEDTMNNLAYLRAEELNDIAGAVALADRLVAMGSKKAAVLDTVGWVYFRNGDGEKAKQYLTESVAIQPAADTYVHLAEVLLAAGDPPGSGRALDEAEKVSPSPQTQQKIKALRDDIAKGLGR